MHFSKTLTDFNLIEKVTQDSFHQLPKNELTDNQVKDILNLYSVCNHTKQINLQTMDSSIVCMVQKTQIWKKSPINSIPRNGNMWPEWIET